MQRFELFLIILSVACGLSRSRAQFHKEISLMEKVRQLTRMPENYLEIPSIKKHVRRRSMQLCWVTSFPPSILSVLTVFIQCGRIHPCPLPVSQPTSHCLHHQGKTTNTLSYSITLIGPKLKPATVLKKASVMTKNNFSTNGIISL